MSGVAEEMVPKAIVDILMQQISSLQNTVEKLTATIEEKDRIIAEKIEIILNQNRARFGQSSEKRTYLLCDGQLSLFEQAGEGVTEKTGAEAPSTEKQQVSVSAHTRKPKRTMEEMCANVPEETVIVDLPEEQKFTADGRPLKCIGTDDVRVELMSESSFERKYQSYVSFLERKLNGCPKRWHGKTREHKALLVEGKEIPSWREIDIRCHDFRVTYCTMCYEAGIPVKTLQVWMGHTDTKLIMEVYTKLTKEKEQADATKLNFFFNQQAKEKENYFSAAI